MLVLTLVGAVLLRHYNHKAQFENLASVLFAVLQLSCLAPTEQCVNFISEQFSVFMGSGSLVLSVQFLSVCYLMSEFLLPTPSVYRRLLYESYSGNMNYELWLVLQSDLNKFHLNLMKNAVSCFHSLFFSLSHTYTHIRTQVVG